jgi:phosphoglycolate phosphatase
LTLREPQGGALREPRGGADSRRTRISPYAAIVFDFDLTLADSRRGFDECHRHAAQSLGLPVPTAEAAGRTIGTPLPLAFIDLYGAAEADKAEPYVKAYQARADAVMTQLTGMLPGAADALETLSEAGLRLGIVSQKLRYRVEDVLRREGLLECFDVILGGEDVPAFKPDPRGLLMAIERLNATPLEALYVGDTTIDAEAANNAGVGFVGLLSGYALREDFDAYKPLAVLREVGELPEYLGAK